MRRFLNAKTVPDEPDAYDGQVSGEELSVGIALARTNAESLLSDARRMKASGSGATALALAVLAMEEAAKEPILMALGLCETDEGRKRRWRDFRAHSAKMAALWSPFGEASADIKARQEALAYLKKLSGAFQAIKEFAFYTDYIVERGKPHWATPATMPDGTIDAVLDMAHMVIGQRSMNEDELRLFLKHVEPVADAPSDQFRRAIEQFELDAIAAGYRDAPASALPSKQRVIDRVESRDEDREPHGR